MNPLAKIDFTDIDSLLVNPVLFGNFSLVIATDRPYPEMSTINAACRIYNRPFYGAGSIGLYGFVFADLILHMFNISREQSNRPTRNGPETSTRSILGHQTSRSSDGKVTEIVTKQEVYSPLRLANTSPLPSHYISARRKRFSVTPILACIRALFEYQSVADRLFPSSSPADTELFVTLATNKHKELQLPPETLRADIMRNFMQNCSTELSPTCAFLGGALTQDAINVLSGREQPIQNFLVFDGEDTKCPVYSLHPPKDLGQVPGTGSMPMGNGFAVPNGNGFPGSLSGNALPPMVPQSDGAADYGLPPIGMNMAMAGMPGADAAQLPQRERADTASSHTLLGDEPTAESVDAPQPGNDGS